MSRKQLPQVGKKRQKVSPSRKRGQKLRRNSRNRGSVPRKAGSYQQRRRPRKAKTLAKMALRRYFIHHENSSIEAVV